MINGNTNTLGLSRYKGNTESPATEVSARRFTMSPCHDTVHWHKGMFKKGIADKFPI